jgi:parallel beta-helix repeat protein
VIKNYLPQWLPRLAFGATVTILLAVRPAQAAPKPKPTSCPLMISACGCVIERAATYVAANDLSATESGQTCIEIKQSKAILNLKGFNVFGKNDGTGTGILIDKGATHVIVEGGDKAGPGAAVGQWKYGIEDDGDHAVIGQFAGVAPVVIPSTLGNTTGIFLNKVNGSIVTQLNASANSAFGLLLSNTTDVTLFNITAANNQEAGIKLDSSNGTSIAAGGTESNGNYGIWLQSSSGNTIFDSNGNTKNGDTGILLAGGSDQNRIKTAGAPSNGKAGIVITLGSTGNTVTITHNQGNGNPNSDMVDMNPNCDSNIWYNNVGNGSQACIK